MTAVSECAGSRRRAPGISRIFAWFAGFGARRRRPITLDPTDLPGRMLRDIGLQDGRGPSLRRAERAPGRRH